jgi:hypothetical protein
MFYVLYITHHTTHNTHIKQITNNKANIMSSKSCKRRKETGVSSYFLMNTESCSDAGGGVGVAWLGKNNAAFLIFVISLLHMVNDWKTVSKN